MAADLTVDNLCGALRHFLKQIAERPDEPVDRDNGLILYGVPGDDVMRAVLDAFGGELKITVRELPAVFGPVFSEEPCGQVAYLWEPSKEPSEPGSACTTHLVSVTSDDPGFLGQGGVDVTA